MLFHGKIIQLEKRKAGGEIMTKILHRFWAWVYGEKWSKHVKLCPYC